MTEENEDKLSPTQELMLEVLAARYRLGEWVWPFDSRLSAHARKLADLGYIRLIDGNVPKTFRATLTDRGVKRGTDPLYEPAYFRKVLFTDSNDPFERQAEYLLGYHAKDPKRYVAGILRQLDQAVAIRETFRAKADKYRGVAKDAIQKSRDILHKLPPDTAVQSMKDILTLEDQVYDIDME